MAWSEADTDPLLCTKASIRDAILINPVVTQLWSLISRFGSRTAESILRHFKRQITLTNSNEIEEI